MTTGQPAMWEAILDNMPRGKWIPIGEILGIIKTNVDLQEDDFNSIAQGKEDTIRWESNARNMLHYRNMTGEIIEDRKENYFIPGV